MDIEHLILDIGHSNPVFCRACPVKKLVPIDHVTTASRCEGEAYKACPLFKEALERAYQSADVDGKSSSNEGEIK